MARALLEAGFTVVYDDQATVEHSHDYGPEETRARAVADGRFNAEWLGRVCFDSLAAARAHVALQIEKDGVGGGERGAAGRWLCRPTARPCCRSWWRSC